MGNEIQKLPDGYAAFVKSFRTAYSELNLLRLKACERAYELGKRIVEFSETTAVGEQVDQYNARMKENGRGGTPIRSHSFVAGLLAGEMLPDENERKRLTQHFAACARGYLADRERGFTLGPKLARLIGKGNDIDAKDVLSLPMPEVDSMADGDQISLRKPANAPKEKDPDLELADMIESALEEFTTRAQAIHAFASQHRKSLKKLVKNERIERALDRVNEPAELIGFAWVYKK